MVKLQSRTSVIIILLMLSTSPLSVTYSFANLNDFQDKEKNNPDIPEDIQKSRLRIILTEKQANGKPEVQHYALPDDFSEDNIQRIPSFEDQTPDWVYVKYNTFHSGIEIFDGRICSDLELRYSISV